VTQAEVRERVRDRAANRCEYCTLQQAHSHLSHHIEHIIARQHGGPDELDNLALACHRCNFRKGPNLTGIDPLTGVIVGLFHPRQEAWLDHFRFADVRVGGLTAVGRATAHVLGMNDARRLDLRRELLVRGEFP
jgi:HNH endonuclease